MIVTVTANAALDVTYDVAELVPHDSHRVLAVHRRAGGKGLNVASVLRCMGYDVVATGFVGGPTGAQIRADLDARGIAHRFVDNDEESRRTVTVVSRHHADATVFNEAGPRVSRRAWDNLLDVVGSLVRETHAAVVVVSGSLPAAVPAEAYAEVVRLCRGASARTIVDADGAALRGALAAGPDLVKPNLHELRRVAGTSEPSSGAAALRRLGAHDIVVSAGSDGVTLVPEHGPATAARLASPVVGNPTGAGDAVVAALAAGIDHGVAGADLLLDAVSWSAAAVLQPVAGSVDPEDVRRLRPQVLIEEVE